MNLKIRETETEWEEQYICRDINDREDENDKDNENARDKGRWVPCLDWNTMNKLNNRSGEMEVQGLTYSRSFPSRIKGLSHEMVNHNNVLFDSLFINHFISAQP